MNTTTIHPAEAYLRNPNNPSSLYVKINGKRRRLFINRQEGVIGIIAERKKRKGYRFYDWASIQAVSLRYNGIPLCARAVWRTM